MRDFFRRHEDRLLPVAGIAGAVVFAIGCATAAMIVRYGAPTAFAIMGRNVPWMPYVAPAALAFTVWLFIDGLTRRGDGGL